MQLFSIQRLAITVGMAAALAIGTGIVPNATNHTPTAQAAELAQHGGGHGGGGQNFHSQGGNNGGGHQGGGHNSFQGHNFRASHGFSHTYWGFGFHRTYPQYYVTYYYEPVNICETYYFDEGAWFCFTGY